MRLVNEFMSFKNMKNIINKNNFYSFLFGLFSLGMAYNILTPATEQDPIESEMVRLSGP